MLLSSGFPHVVAFFPPTQLPHGYFQPVQGQSVAGTGVDLRHSPGSLVQDAIRREGHVWINVPQVFSKHVLFRFISFPLSI
jgi:hypothetical protein